MPVLNGFCAPAYESRSATADNQRLVNLYVEKDEVELGRNGYFLYGTPGTSVFTTLPTSPVRGIWAGENRLFAVAGSKFYEIFSNGTYTDRGSVGSGTGPAQIFANGSQVMIVAGGHVYIDDGTSITQPLFTAAKGYVNTSGTAVNVWFGDTFDDKMVNNTIIINSTAYTVASVTDAYHLVLTSSAGTQTGVLYSIPNTGQVMVNGTSVLLVSGDEFTTALAGGTIYIANASYTVATVVSPRQLTLTTTVTPTLLPVGYAATLTVAAQCGAFLDGYFIAVLPYSKQVNISQINNGLNWNPTEYGYKEAYPDNIQAIIADHEELWLLGSQSIEVWRNTGNADFPFERDQGAMIHLGIAAPASACRFGTGISFLSIDGRGGPIAYATQGFQPVRISTHAVEYAWSAYSTIADAESYSYREAGHEFLVIQFPSANATWVYDLVEKAWHQRAYGANLDRHKGRCYAYQYGKHLVGDHTSGVIHAMSLETTDDEGTGIKRVRRAPHIAHEVFRSFYHEFRLDMQYGASLACTLSWSDDLAAGSGAAWTTPRSPDGSVIARSGAALAQSWRRLGSSRDRVFEVVVTGTGKVALINAYLELTAGR